MTTSGDASGTTHGGRDVDAPTSVSLWTPGRDRLLLELVRCLEHRDFDRVDLVVSFVQRSGVALLAESIEAATARGACVRVLTTDYLCITDPAALGWMLDRSGPALEVRVYSEPRRSFHPKAYLFRSTHGRAASVAFVGSSNLSYSALVDGVEWNLRVHEVAPLAHEFEGLWRSPYALPLTRDWLAAYALRPRPTVGGVAEVSADDVDPGPRPNTVQAEALLALEATRRDGHVKALVVLATGLGKTWLAAFDSTRLGFARVIFIAHRDELLAQARDTFRRARPAARLSIFNGSARDLEGDVVFASVISLRNALSSVEPGRFDYAVVDEFHHAHAESYRAVLAHLRPKFLLGLTATPVRMDGADIAALCDDNVLRVCDLVEGIRRGLLSPFSYRGVRDVVDLSGVPFARGRFAERELGRAVSTEERARLALDEWRRMGASRTLGFCVTTGHADFMAAYFRERGVDAVAVHSGETSAGRAVSLERLRSGSLPVLFSVDLFNEGLDVPLVDGVLMLRPTESPVVFLQQIGRGLRIAPHKERLRVVDLVANHRSALLKARLLAELMGAREDGALGDHLARLRLPPPEGITLDLAEIEGILDELAALRPADPLRAFVDAWTEQRGARPSLLQVTLSDPSLVGPVRRQGWARWLKSNSPVDAPERDLEDAACRFLLAAERLPQTRAFTTLALERFIALGGSSGPVSVRRFALDCRDALLADAYLRRDLARTDAFDNWLKPEDEPWLGWWRATFLAPLLGNDGGGALLRIVGDSVALALEASPPHVVTWSLLEEVLAWRRWLYVSTLRPMFRDATGRELDAEFAVAGDGTRFVVTVEARGGERGNVDRRNTQYDAGFDLCLERLRALRGRLIDAEIDSRAVRDLPAAQRSIMPGSGAPIDLAAVVDIPALRRTLTSRARKVGQAPGAKGGNAQKRVALTFELPTPHSATDVERALVWGPTAPLTPASTPAPAHPAAR